jgi:hypothetical protein
MFNEIFGEIFGTINEPQPDKTRPDKITQLKNRMRTTIAQAKQYDKETFRNRLAADYIRISKEI